VDTALLLAKVFENTPDFRLNAQRRSDLWKALNTPERKAKIDRAKSIREVAA
jgi:plasmid maintenance system antidote protein VapI